MTIHNFKYKQVIVIRKDVEMSPAKLGVQISHGAIESYIHSDKAIRDEWYMEGMRKVVLMVKDLDELIKIESKATNQSIKTLRIIDFGLTEVEPNTITGLTFGICEADVVDKITKRLRLYK